MLFEIQEPRLFYFKQNFDTKKVILQQTRKHVHYVFNDFLSYWLPIAGLKNISKKEKIKNYLRITFILGFLHDFYVAQAYIIIPSYRFFLSSLMYDL